jgi:hypothetical protein
MLGTTWKSNSLLFHRFFSPCHFLPWRGLSFFRPVSLRLPDDFTREP